MWELKIKACESSQHYRYLVVLIEEQELGALAIRLSKTDTTNSQTGRAWLESSPDRMLVCFFLEGAPRVPASWTEMALQKAFWINFKCVDSSWWKGQSCGEEGVSGVSLNLENQGQLSPSATLSVEELQCVYVVSLVLSNACIWIGVHRMHLLQTDSVSNSCLWG